MLKTIILYKVVRDVTKPTRQRFVKIEELDNNFENRELINNLVNLLNDMNPRKRNNILNNEEVIYYDSIIGKLLLFDEKD